jgi:nicotinamidase-related amidase
VKKIDLLIIDPQNDFCRPDGALSVKGADKDMENVAKMILKGKSKIDNIRVTLDSHHYIHIAHPIWWKDAKGNSPAPFTIITYNDLIGNNPKWTTMNPGFLKRSIEYVKKLQDNARYPLCIWPPHCIIGSFGHAIFPELFDALIEWEKQFAVVDKVVKGTNIFTEHYSAVKSDVEDSNDPATLLNTNFIMHLQEADVIGIAGEALSHCVANTIRDISNEFGPEQTRKFVLLEDACSNVSGFEQFGIDFVKEMTGKGMQISNTKDFLSL